MRLTESDRQLIEQIAYGEERMPTRLNRDTLFEKVERLYPRLTEIAHEGRTTSYWELTDGFTIAPGEDIGKILGIIGIFEDEQGRPPIFAVVTRKNEEGPGPGFFSLLEAIGENVPESDEKRHQIWRTHLTDVHKFWSEAQLTHLTEETAVDEEPTDLKPPQRTETEVSRIIRNTSLVKDLKHRYSHTCQVCGDRRKQGPDNPYAEAHHIKPLGDPHHGPDDESNVVVLCPNHHADFDYGVIAVDPDDLTISHQYDDRVDGAKLNVRSDHDLAATLLSYHNENISSVKP